MKPLSTLPCESEILQRLSYKQVPVLSPGIPRLLQSLTDDDITFTELSCILEQYPSIAARLIAAANSAWSSPATEITSLEMACSRLGLNVIRSISIAIAVAAPFDPNRCPGFNARQFWSSALLAADGASMLASKSESENMDSATARAAGLMHNLGLLLLADQLPVEVHESIQLLQKEEYDHLSDALQFMLGFNHCDAGKLLGEAWKLPPVLVNAMAYHIVEADPDIPATKSASLIKLTVSMIYSMQNSLPWSIPKQLLESLQISQSDASAIFKRLAKQQEKIEEMADSLFSR